MSKPLPGITHLQFLILDALAGGDRAGRDLRARLADHGVRNSAPAFYQMMARLEASGFVEGWYEQSIVEGQIIKERRYTLAKAGTRALDETHSFYLDRASSARRRKAHA
jgi:DNA-binding PadR family transcriptional regulator